MFMASFMPKAKGIQQQNIITLLQHDKDIRKGLEK